MTCADLGACVRTADGSLLAVFGDTFSGSRVGRGDWRSPVALIGRGDARAPIVWERAGGPDPDYARQLLPYVHDQAGVSTVIPSDLLRLGDTIYLHAIVNRGLGNVLRTELWRSDDGGRRWRAVGENATFPADLHHGHAQCWSWDLDPDGGWVYVMATGFQRDKGIIAMRVRPSDIADRAKYSAWGFTGGRWGWGRKATPITPPGERWGELTFRRLAPRTWVLGGFLASRYALGYRVIDSPVADLHTAPLQLPVRGCGWHAEDHAGNRIAQLYGGYLLPGSRLDVPGGVGLVVSQWHTDTGWPYRAMQFSVTLHDTRQHEERRNL
ncbi:hypothetical protein MCHLDSM_04418 [Mycolicibacterium chlorophenolicum]|uniref:DUF4185 domain-containing protein n=1 Tax=Mycolicibacterium chlorophenolicum TaxID=37916 RepID=A0A0J6VN36_9MYCO|nr:hypothetical protein MCHLDSM_04418 [Mycolicibacterium chlorophenolicum]